MNRPFIFIYRWLFKLSTFLIYPSDKNTKVTNIQHSNYRKYVTLSEKKKKAVNTLSQKLYLQIRKCWMLGDIFTYKSHNQIVYFRLHCIYRLNNNQNSWLSSWSPLPGWNTYFLPLAMVIYIPSFVQHFCPQLLCSFVGNHHLLV